MSRCYPTSRLNKLIGLQAPKEAPDQAGGFEVLWVDVAKVWAEVQALNYNKLSVGEHFQFGQLLSLSAYQITIRYRKNMATNMRIIYDGRVFNIRRIINIEEKNRLLRLIAEEGVAT